MLRTVVLSASWRVAVALLCSVSALATVGRAQIGPAGAIAIEQARLDALTDAVVLNLAAHPDDESARTMVYLRNRFGVRTVTAYATCGEGGQNAIGRAIGRELAAIRARETLAAAARYGTEVRWLGFPDFGFSKSLEETREVWGAEEVLARFGALLDEIRPDVVITNHSIDRGHGHHRTVAWALQQLCPERGIPLYERYAAQFDGDDSESEKESVAGVYEFEVGAVDPLRGATFARQAHEAWVLHESQGPWGDHDPTRVSPDRWLQVWPDRLVDPRPPLSWSRPVFEDPFYAGACAVLGIDFDPVVHRSANLATAPDAVWLDVFEELQAVRGHLEWLSPDSKTQERRDRVLDRVQRRIETVGRYLAYRRGFALETYTSEDGLPFGGAIPLRARLVGVMEADGGSSGDGGRGSEPALQLVGLTLDGEAVTIEPDEQGFYEIPLQLPDSAEGDPVVDLTRVFRFRLGVELMLDEEPVAFSRQIAVRVLPTTELSWSREAAFVPAAGSFRRAYSLEVAWRGGGTLDAPVVLRAPEAFEVEAFPKRVTLDKNRRSARITVRVERRASDDARPLGDLPFSLQARVGEAGVATLELRPFAVPAASDDRPIGLVRGPEDTTERFLADLGVPFVTLDETGLAVADFSEFRTIVLDIRAYHHRPELADHRERLFEYCRSGGRIVCFYHKPREWNEAPGRPSLAPFELKTSRLRVAEEDAPIEFLQPDHQLWNEPFDIGREDFEGWVQERGLNFPSERDAAWVPLLVSHDEGEEPLDSALLYARYGRGDYVYCSLALYRQLRRAHPGAARLSLNLFLGGAD